MGCFCASGDWLRARHCWLIPREGRASSLHACICDKDGRIRKHGDNRPTIALTEESLKDVDADCKDFASNPVDHQKLLEIAERYPRRAAQADADCYATKQYRNHPPTQSYDP